MKLLCVGQCFGYEKQGFASSHGGEARDLGIARGLARLGWQVDLVATVPGPTVDGLLNMVKWEKVSPGQYDAIVIVANRAWRCAQKHQAIAESISAHPNVVGVLDAVWPDVDPDFLRAAGFTSPQLTARYRQHNPGRDGFSLPWGMATIPENLVSPWKEDACRAIYAGIVRDIYLETFNKLAEDSRFEVWVAGLFPNAQQKMGGLNDEERNRLCHPNLRFVSDLAPQYARGHYGHGPVLYGSHWPFLVHASVGLNILDGDWTPHISCKLYDYLGAGLPVVSTTGVPNVGDITTLRLGRIVPQGDIKALADGIIEEAAVKRDRAKLRREAQAMGTWDDAALILDAHIRKK